MGAGTIRARAARRDRDGGQPIAAHDARAREHASLALRAGETLTLSLHRNGDGEPARRTATLRIALSPETVGTMDLTVTVTHADDTDRGRTERNMLTAAHARYGADTYSVLSTPLAAELQLREVRRSEVPPAIEALLAAMTATMAGTMAAGDTPAELHWEPLSTTTETET